MNVKTSPLAAATLLLAGVFVFPELLPAPVFADESTASPAVNPDQNLSVSTGTIAGRSWYSHAWRHVETTARDGGWDLYVPFYTYHMPYAYTQALLRSYNDYPAGGGLGRGRYNERGNWEGLVAMEFADSHSKPEYLGAYVWLATWRPFSENSRVGAGLTGFITARSDIGHYTPVPGVLPVASIGYRFLDLQASFLPGGKNDGNVLFCWAKLSFY
jgi:palmitoyl transferase